MDDQYVQICQHFSAALDEALGRMPLLEGPKKPILDCNYTAETLLRFIRTVDLSVFWYFAKAVRIYRECANGETAFDATRVKPKEEEVKKIMNELFTFPQSTQNTEPI